MSGAPGQLSSQLVSSMLSNLNPTSGGGGGQSPIMQHLQSGYLCGVVPLKVRVSVGLEQLGGFKGLNSPIFQLANQMFNCGSSFGLGQIWEELKALLSGDKQDWAGDINDAMSLLAQMGLDRNFDGAMASMENLRIQNLPVGLPVDNFDSRSMIV